jgi:type IV pilus assembly protein PilM
MGLLSGVSEFFGLDIGASAIRIVELRGHGAVKTLVRYAYTPIDSKLTQSDSKDDAVKVMEIVKSLITEAKLNTNNVAVGLPSKRVFTTVVDVDKLSPDDLAKSIRFQADSLIPTPISSSKVDWAVIGPSVKEANKLELLLTSVPNNFIEARLDMLESIGLNVLSFEPDNLAMARALSAPGAPEAEMILNIGTISSDIVIIQADAARLTRSIPMGSEAIIRAAAQNLSIEHKQAEEIVYKFGLDKTKLEGQVHDSIITTIENLVTEVDKSIKFFQGRYTTAKLDRIIMTGAAAVLPEFPLFIANKFSVKVEIGNAWRNISFAASKEKELLSVSNYFGVAAGLAERIE